MAEQTDVVDDQRATEQQLQQRAADDYRTAQAAREQDSHRAA
jgi:hypothetical protein